MPVRGNGEGLVDSIVVPRQSVLALWEREWDRRCLLPRTLEVEVLVQVR